MDVRRPHLYVREGQVTAGTCGPGTARGRPPSTASSSEAPSSSAPERAFCRPPLPERYSGHRPARRDKRETVPGRIFTPGAVDLRMRIELLAERLTPGLKPLAPVAYNYALELGPGRARRVPGHQPAPLAALRREPRAVPQRPLAVDPGGRGAQPRAARARRGSRGAHRRDALPGAGRAGASTGLSSSCAQSSASTPRCRSTRAVSASWPATS